MRDQPSRLMGLSETGVRGEPFRFGADRCQTVVEPGSIRVWPVDSATARKIRAHSGKGGHAPASTAGCQFGIVPEGSPGPPLVCRLKDAYTSVNDIPLPPQKQKPQERVPVGTKK